MVATGGITPFVVSITPAGGYGPLSSTEDHELPFTVHFQGIPCAAADRIYTGFLDVVADGAVVARKPVQITVRACKLHNYSVKFICGVQEGCDCSCAPVRPGIYATEINIYNYQRVDARVEKRVVPLVFAGAPQGREPRAVGARATDRILLRAGTATMDDCCRIAELLFGTPPPAKLPLTVGFLEITSPVELQVTAVYTATDLESRAVSIDVEQVTGKMHPARRRAAIGTTTGPVTADEEASTEHADAP